MPRSFYTLAALLGFLFGVGLFAGYRVPFFISAAAAGIFLALALGAFVARRFADTRPFSYLALLFVFLFAGALGMSRAAFSVHAPTPATVDFYNEKEVTLTGMVKEVDVRQDQVKYTINAETLAEKDSINAPVPVSGRVLVTLEKYPRHAYGERVTLTGRLRAPGQFDGFRYDHYLSRHHIYSVMYRPGVELISMGHGSALWGAMLWLRERFLVQISRLFPEPQASFEAGLLVGARKGIPEEIMEEFNLTGLTHIVAISGYNITLIVVFITWILGGLPRKAGFAAAIAAITLFTLFVGASPAVVRAAIMGILGLLALHSGRQTHVHLLVLFTAFFMVLFNPKILWWDAGFQLSFAAVLGLIYVAPLFERISARLPAAFGIREALTLTVSAQIMALPLILYHFDRLSLIAPLSNLLVAFAIPPAMLFGFIAVMVGFFLPSLALIPAFVAHTLLSYILAVIHFTSRVPYASVELPGMTLLFMAGYYAALAGFIAWRFHFKRRPKGLLRDPVVEPTGN